MNHAYELVTQLLTGLAPFIAQGALAKLGEDTTDRVTALVGRAWGRVQAWGGGSRQSDAALTLYEETPHDQGLQARVAQHVAARLEHDPAALEELRRLLDELHALPQTRQTMTARNIRRTAQEAHGREGDVQQRMDATEDIEDAQQVSIGTRPPPRLAVPSADTNRRRSRTIFLSHTSEDKPQVRELSDWLRANGFTPWLDEERLVPGQAWQAEVARAVRECGVFLVCLTARAVTQAGYLHKEIALALDVADEQPDGTIFVIPARLEDCTVPERLRRWQWVNLYEAGGAERLLAALRHPARRV